MKDDEENENYKSIRISSMQRMMKTIETNIFSFFYALLEDKEEFYWFNVAAITITFIQGIGFGFRDDVKISSFNIKTKF